MKLKLGKFSNYLNSLKIPLRLSCTTQSGWPVVVSLWYLFQDDVLLCATQQSARVVAYLEENPRCGFEIAEDRMPYCGIRGQALASFDARAGGEVLELLLHRYLGSLENPLARELLSRKGTETAIILKPVQVFSWDFSKRMKAVGSVTKKICP